MRGPKEVPLEIDRREGDGAGSVVLAVSGDLVLASRDSLRSAVEAELADGARRVVVDLSETTHVDTPGFALLVRLSEECAERSVELVVAALPGAFRGVCEALCLPDYLRMTDEVDGAPDPGA